MILCGVCNSSNCVHAQAGIDVMSVTVQMKKCLMGLHEVEDIVLLGECETGRWTAMAKAYYRNEGISLPVCRHCRCLYVERQ